MKTGELIRELARQGVPVRPCGRPLIRFCQWAVAASLFIAIGVVVLGLRVDVATVSQSPEFVWQSLFMLGVAAVCATSAFTLSVPDKRSLWLTIVPLATLVAWSVLIAGMLFSASYVQAGPGLKCLRNILALSFAPGALLYFMLRRAAALNVGAVGLLAALGVAALACLGTRFICHDDNPVHLLVWHYVPVLALGGFGTWLGGLILRRTATFA